MALPLKTRPLTPEESLRIEREAPLKVGDQVDFRTPATPLAAGALA